MPETNNRNIKISVLHGLSWEASSLHMYSLSSSPSPKATLLRRLTLQKGIGFSSWGPS